MRNNLQYIFILSGVIILSILIISICIKITNKKFHKNSINVVPEVSFYDLNGNIWTSSFIEKDKPTVFFYFNSTCDYCKNEAKLVRNRINDFGNAELIFISSEDIEYIRIFSIDYQLDCFENVYFLHDPELNFSHAFGFNVVPTTLVYNSKGSLVEFFKGSVNIDLVIDALNLEYGL